MRLHCQSKEENSYFCCRKRRLKVMESKKEIAQNQMNQWGKQQIPFLFLIDFELKKPVAIPLSKINPDELLYDIQGRRNFTPPRDTSKPLEFKAHPVTKDRYCKAFRRVQKHIHRGDSFLLNLTFPSTVETNYSLKDIFYHSRAKYKIWFKNHFVSFSPEIFVQTRGRLIRSFPMKGTLDATLPQAEKKLLSNKKELAEHFTIVDLIRNDLSMVAKNVKVNRFRYLDHIKTNKNEILQMSSEIEGILPENFREKLGDILFRMLPAGSISGAPKKKTLEIIRQAEVYQRGFYTGIAGIFDGEDIDSAVLIRFIEQTENGLVYKSGGGITGKSRCEDEYEELIEKIYVPIA